MAGSGIAGSPAVDPLGDVIVCGWVVVEVGLLVLDVVVGGLRSWAPIFLSAREIEG